MSKLVRQVRVRIWKQFKISNMDRQRRHVRLEIKILKTDFHDWSDFSISIFFPQPWASSMSTIEGWPERHDPWRAPSPRAFWALTLAPLPNTIFWDFGQNSIQKQINGSRRFVQRLRRESRLLKVDYCNSPRSTSRPGSVVDHNSQFELQTNYETVLGCDLIGFLIR